MKKTVLFEELWAGDRFLFLNSIWTKIGPTTARKHSNEEFLLKDKSYGYVASPIYSLDVKDPVEFIPASSEYLEIKRNNAQEEMIDDLISIEVEELVRSIKSGNEETPGDIRHVLRYGRRGYDSWTPAEIEKEWSEKTLYYGKPKK